MKETTPARTSHGAELNSAPVSLAMPPCFDRWCQKFDNLLRNKSQKREFRHYLGGLLGESERKNIYQMASDSVGVSYHKFYALPISLQIMIFRGIQQLPSRSNIMQSL